MYTDRFGVLGVDVLGVMEAVTVQLVTGLQTAGTTALVIPLETTHYDKAKFYVYTIMME